MQESQEMQVWSLGWEDPLEKDMATHSSILAWEIMWTEETGWPQFIMSQRVGHDWSNLACMQWEIWCLFELCLFLIFPYLFIYFGLYQVLVAACRLLITLCRLNCSSGMGNSCGILAPQPGIKPTSPALAGEFLATEPPGKSLSYVSLHMAFYLSLWNCI